MLNLKTITLFFAGLLATSTFAENYKYNELMIKDYDEMSKLVHLHIKKAQKVSGEDENELDSEAIDILREGLKLVFSRPNSDNMIAKLIPDLRRELVNYQAYETSFEPMAKNAIEIVKSKNAATITQSTALIILENILSEIRPEVERGNANLRKVMEQIRDADLELSTAVIKERKLRGMLKSLNPSDEAKTILKAIDKAAKKKK